MQSIRAKFRIAGKTDVSCRSKKARLKSSPNSVSLGEGKESSSRWGWRERSCSITLSWAFKTATALLIALNTWRRKINNGEWDLFEPQNKQSINQGIDQSIKESIDQSRNQSMTWCSYQSIPCSTGTIDVWIEKNGEKNSPVPVLMSSWHTPPAPTAAAARDRARLLPLRPSTAASQADQT